jgi:hypothetical protein
MKISLNWLSQYIDLSGLSVDEMSDMLTFAGIEVEDIRQQGVDSPYVVVARVAAAEQHPQADRLKVCQVDVGDGTLHQIVCGAQNYKVGDKVPCALPGAVLPGNFEIKVGKAWSPAACSVPPPSWGFPTRSTVSGFSPRNWNPARLFPRLSRRIPWWKWK